MNQYQPLQNENEKGDDYEKDFLVGKYKTVTTISELKREIIRIGILIFCTFIMLIICVVIIGNTMIYSLCTGDEIYKKHDQCRFDEDCNLNITNLCAANRCEIGLCIVIPKIKNTCISSDMCIDGRICSVDCLCIELIEKEKEERVDFELKKEKLIPKRIPEIEQKRLKIWSLIKKDLN
jgi:hypothetical protein